MDGSNRTKQEELLDFIGNTNNIFQINKSEDKDNEYNFLFTENSNSPGAKRFKFKVSNTFNTNGEIIPNIKCTNKSNSEIELNNDELAVVFEHIVHKNIREFKGLNSVMTIAAIHYKSPNIPIFCSKIGKTESIEGEYIDMPNNLTEVLGNSVKYAKSKGKQTASVLVACSWHDYNDSDGVGKAGLKQHMVTMTVDCSKFDNNGKLTNDKKLDKGDCLIFDNSYAIEKLPDDIKGQFQAILNFEDGNL